MPKYGVGQGFIPYLWQVISYRDAKKSVVILDGPSRICHAHIYGEEEEGGRSREWGGVGGG